MHHALEINEILRHIFLHLEPETLKRAPRTQDHIAATSNLAALARTCHAFKEPALDELWKVLIGLSSLARCLPEASSRSSIGNRYTFVRSPTKTEWDILQGYARRVRSIMDFHEGLSWESVKSFLNPPPTESLFPNLRNLHCDYTQNVVPLLHLPLPSLVTLDIRFMDRIWFPNQLALFPTSSPNIKELSFTQDGRSNFPLRDRIQPNHLSRWQNLLSLSSIGLALNMDDLVHLSRIPALLYLQFSLDSTFSASNTSLTFSNLCSLSLYSTSLEPISRLLFTTRLPALTCLRASYESHLDPQDLAFFLASVQASITCHPITKLELDQFYEGFRNHRSRDLVLGFEDLQPCMAFSSLRHVVLNIASVVRLTEVQVLALASALPELEYFSINAKWGWNTSGECGVTPGGLVQLLQMCPSLHGVALCLDTRGYTQVPRSHLPENLGLTLSSFTIDVVDSAIGSGSVVAIATFICCIAACTTSYISLHWRTADDNANPWMRDWELWANVDHLLSCALGPRFHSGHPESSAGSHDSADDY